MAPWQVYQQIAGELGVPPDTTHLVNVLADGGHQLTGTNEETDLPHRRK